MPPVERVRGCDDQGVEIAGIAREGSQRRDDSGVAGLQRIAYAGSQWSESLRQVEELQRRRVQHGTGHQQQRRGRVRMQPHREHLHRAIAMQPQWLAQLTEQIRARLPSPAARMGHQRRFLQAHDPLATPIGSDRRVWKLAGRGRHRPDALDPGPQIGRGFEKGEHRPTLRHLSQMFKTAVVAAASISRRRVDKACYPSTDKGDEHAEESWCCAMPAVDACCRRGGRIGLEMAVGPLVRNERRRFQ